MNLRPGRIGLCLAGPALLWAAPASAQLSGSVTVTSDHRFRGHSVASGEPAVIAELGLDGPSGFYLGALVTAAVVEDSPEFVNFSANLGYAHRISPRTTIDLGVVRSEYTEYFSGGRPAHFTEIYAGLQHRPVAAYIRYSPDYLRPGVETLYGELEASIEPAELWRLNAHFGLLVQIAGPLPDEHGRTSYDWKVGVERQLGRFDLGLAVSGGGPGPDYYRGIPHDRTAIVASLRWHL